MLPIKSIVLVVHVILVKPSAMQKLKEMNIIIQLKVLNHQNTLDIISTTVKCYIKCSTNAKTRENLQVSYIALWEPDLNEQNILKD